MPALPYLAAVGLALVVDGYTKGEEARSEAKKASERSRVAQEKSQSENKANQAAQQAQASRKAYREERVRRARILQSSENTGTAGSSGEYGALGNLETQLSTNIGAQVGSAASSDRLSGYAQETANAQFDFQNAQQGMSSAGSQMSLGMSLFSVGSSGAGKAAPSTTPVPDLKLSPFEYTP